MHARLGLVHCAHIGRADLFEFVSLLPTRKAHATSRQITLPSPGFTVENCGLEISAFVTYSHKNTIVREALYGCAPCVPFMLTFIFTELSMLLLKNECKWLRWSHFFEEEDTGDLDHKAIYNIISAIAEISIKAMPDLRRDEILRRWYSYTLRGT